MSSNGRSAKLVGVDRALALRVAVGAPLDGLDQAARRARHHLAEPVRAVAVRPVVAVRVRGKDDFLEEQLDAVGHRLAEAEHAALGELEEGLIG